MIKECTLKDLARDFDYFVLDADGVIWEQNIEIGDSSKALKFLMSSHKSIFIVTNNSHKSRAEYIAKADKVLGIHIPENCWYPSSRTTALFLKSKYPSFKSAYIVGGPGLCEELSLAGFTKLYGMEDSKKEFQDNTFWEKDMKENGIPDCVVAGLDPGFNYYKLIYATNCIHKHSKFIATNQDAGIKNGRFLMPGAGTIVSAIQKASGVKAITIGKPNSFSLDYIMEENKIPLCAKDKMIMIGDRLETDILFAKNCGIKSCLVLTGVSTKEFAENEAKKGVLAPDFIMKQIGTF